VPIPGTTKSHRLEENLGAADIEMTAGDLTEIERAAAAIHVEGEWYPERLMATTARCAFGPAPRRPRPATSCIGASPLTL
jgi:hypothetical protein